MAARPLRFEPTASRAASPTPLGSQATPEEIEALLARWRGHIVTLTNSFRRQYKYSGEDVRDMRQVLNAKLARIPREKWPHYGLMKTILNNAARDYNRQRQRYEDRNKRLDDYESTQAREAFLHVATQQKQGDCDTVRDLLFALTPEQRSLVQAHFGIGEVFEMPGPVDPAALEEALEAMRRAAKGG